MTIGFISHPDCARHEMGSGHPECPARLGAIEDRMIASGLHSVLRHYDAPLATRQQLRRVHRPEYVDHIFESAPSDGLAWIDPDTAMNPHTLAAALRAAGAAVHGVDLVMRNETSTVFCCVRPPGHHAERARAMGFCFFNNVAVGAAHALAMHKLERVAIVDFDVHHGNGTEDIFRREPRVMLCSTFQHPFYPFSGAGNMPGHIINVPLAAGSSGGAFAQAVEERWLPALEEFRPQLILISAGFDAHVEDDMAGLALTEPDYAWVTSQIRSVAERHAQGRIVSILEGGYALSALGRSVAAHLQALL
ncbi:MAG: histone deacetylase family protein [Pseudomonadota bacterium]|nr:MAG: histone deacetylase family protein [Pseudomonadota bacterium]